MIRSMTGFGAASTEVNGAHYAVEIRSLNNRYFKSQVRLPEEIQGLESELEAILARMLVRGSVVLTVKCADTSPEAAAQINQAAIERYLGQVLEAKGTDHAQVHVDLAALLALPGVLVQDAGADRLEKARDVLKQLVEKACEAVIAMRTTEGESLHADLSKHLDLVADRLDFIRDHAPQVVSLYQERLQQRMNTLLSEIGKEAREEDLLKEVASFAERADIHEEIARQHGHLEHFRGIIDSDDPEPAGRTLDFIAQEMLREANTMGSKCLDADISRRIVEMKGAIDRIKEQVQNVE